MNNRNVLNPGKRENVSYPKFSNKKNMPNIYYIVLDSYAGYKELKKILNHDNGDFINFLKNNGFFVTEENHSNYNWTYLSLSSTLNLDYLPMKNVFDYTFEIKRGENILKGLIYNKVVYFLKSCGYEYIDLSIWNKFYLSLDFIGGLLNITPLGLPYVTNFIGGLLFKDYVLSIFDSIEKSFEVERPFFLYAHILIPHFPIIFDEKGNRPDFFESDIIKLYIGQLKYTNSRIKGIIEKIFLSRSGKKPIIIIQGDHGVNLYLKDKQEQMRMRTSILNAIYLPDRKENIFYDGMTPVNTFRILFHEYFGTNLEILPDITYYQDKERGRLVIYRTDN